MLRAVIRTVLVVLVLFVVTSPLAAVAAPPSPGTYIVQRGDTLARIAARLGVSGSALARANGISDANRIYAGQTLTIPGSSALPPQPPSPGDTGGAGASGSGGVYIVQRGDTLSSIAQRLGVSVQALLRANGLSNANFVYAGQQLEVPGGDAAPQPQPASPTPVPTAVPAQTLPPDASPSPSPDVAPAPDVAPTPAPSAGEGETPDVNAVPDALANPDGPHPTPEGMDPNALAAEAVLLPDASPEARAALEAAKAGRWIDVNLSAQSLTAYEGKRPVFTTRVSSGVARTPTVAGTYKIYVKVPSQTMTGPGYRLPRVPYVMFFYKGYGIHGTYWHNNFGHPMSHGCVNVSTPDAAWLYAWAKVGTPVVTHY